MYHKQGRIFFKELGISDYETDLIVKWRNSESARKYFFITDVVTPGSHREFIATKDNDDIIFSIRLLSASNYDIMIGMIGLKVYKKLKIAEYGRIFIDEKYRRKGFAEEATKLMFDYAFTILNLDYLWLDVYPNNNNAIALYKKLGWKYAYNCIYEGRLLTRMIYRKENYKGNNE